MNDLNTLPPMRALSWKNPYAMLMLCGKIETRTWDTKFRGPVLMCASKVEYNSSIVFAYSGPHQMDRILTTLWLYRSSEYIRTAPNSPNPSFNGHAFAVGNLVDSRPMTVADEDACFVMYRSDLYCHIYEDVRPIQPFPWKGVQGWKVVDEETKKQIVYI